MATSDLAVIDTNVLVYAFDRDAQHFEDSRALVDAAIEPDAGLLVTPQVVAEFLAVTTGSRVDTPIEPAQAAATLGALLARPGIAILPVVPSVPARLLELLTRHPVRGVRVQSQDAIHVRRSERLSLRRDRRTPFLRFRDLDTPGHGASGAGSGSSLRT